MAALVIALEDPRAADVRALLERHLAFAHETSPPEDVHALDVAGLLDASIAFFGARHDGELVAVGALKQLDPSHGELKSMHTAAAARRQGAGRFMLEYLLALARDREYERVSLETGSMEAFAPARTLYRSAGFRECGPFGDYAPSPNSTFMTIALGPHRSAPGSMMGRETPSTGGA
jgi:putative acetyltransferase